MLYKILPEVVTCLELLTEVCTWPRAITRMLQGEKQWETAGHIGCRGESLMPQNPHAVGWDVVGLTRNWIWAVWWEQPQSGIDIISRPLHWPDGTAISPRTCTRTAHHQRIQGDISAVKRENRHRKSPSYWWQFIMKLYHSGLWMSHRKVIYCSNFSSI